MAIRASIHRVNEWLINWTVSQFHAPPSCLSFTSTIFYSLEKFSRSNYSSKRCRPHVSRPCCVMQARLKFKLNFFLCFNTGSNTCAKLFLSFNFCIHNTFGMHVCTCVGASACGSCACTENCFDSARSRLFPSSVFAQHKTYLIRSKVDGEKGEREKKRDDLNKIIVFNLVFASEKLALINIGRLNIPANKRNYLSSTW